LLAAVFSLLLALFALGLILLTSFCASTTSTLSVDNGASAYECGYDRR
jgi:hypothetical protein